MKSVRQWCYQVIFCCLCIWSLLTPSDILVEAAHRSSPEHDSIPAVYPISHVRRTGYHFQPPQHWINDPNGPMYYNGLYHLFYQYNPKGSVWGNIVWAHSVSEDLINWISLKPAITPSKEFDMQGCWSGSATILPGNKPVIFYTGIDPQHNQVQNLAFPANLSDPFLRDWVKPDYNPVIVPGPETNTSAFRDPTTAWWNRGYWKTVVGSRDNGITGTAYLYKSKDFRKWEKTEEPLHTMENTGMWECPDFYPVRAKGGKRGLETSAVGEGVKHVFKVSLDLTRFEYYTIGKYDVVNDKYVPDKGMVDGWNGLRYDYGNFYASKSFYDKRGDRRILWGWANESDAQSADVKKGWAGVQLIPREVWLDSNGKQLLQWPIAEIELLRTNPVNLGQHKLNVGDVHEIKDVTAAQADVEVVFKLPESLDKAEQFDPSWVNAQDLCAKKGSTVQGGVGPFGLLTLASEGLEEYTPVFFRIFKTEVKDNHVVLMCSDASSSTLLPDPCETKAECMYKPSFAGFVNVDLTSRKLALRSLIDHSVVESFGAKGKTCITSRVYPIKAVGLDAHLYAFNNGTEPIIMEKLEAWSMQKPLKMNQPLDEIRF